MQGSAFRSGPDLSPLRVRSAKAPSVASKPEDPASRGRPGAVNSPPWRREGAFLFPIPGVLVVLGSLTMAIPFRDRNRGCRSRGAIHRSNLLGRSGWGRLDAWGTPPRSDTFSLAWHLTRAERGRSLSRVISYAVEARLRGVCAGWEAGQTRGFGRNGVVTRKTMGRKPWQRTLKGNLAGLNEECPFVSRNLPTGNDRPARKARSASPCRTAGALPKPTRIGDSDRSLSTRKCLALNDGSPPNAAEQAFCEPQANRRRSPSWHPVYQPNFGISHLRHGKG